MESIIRKTQLKIILNEMHKQNEILKYQHL